MTPEAIRILSQLRHEFYTLFETAMKVPVRVTNRNSYGGVAYWVDAQQRLNHLRVFAHTAPDELVLQRPLMLRLAINMGEDAAMIRQKKDGQELNRSWHFELIVTPEELLDFLPWVVSLVRSHDTSSASVVPEPPHPLDFELDDQLLFNKIRTKKASSVLNQQLTPNECFYVGTLQKKIG